MKVHTLISFFLFAPVYTTYSVNDDMQLRDEILSIMHIDDLKETKRNQSVEDDPIEKKEFLCVSLGYNCFPALNFDHNNIRDLAFPFDWNLTSLHGIIKIIENDFSDFLNPAYIDRRQGMFNIKYDMSFAHDLPGIKQTDGSVIEVPNHLDYIPELQIKYERRIKRFYNVCNLADKVYFFRLKSAPAWRFDPYPQNREQVIQLRDTLMKKFPFDNWTLVVIDSDLAYKSDWGIPKVKNFYISDHGIE